jgi:hypothetical protein
VSESVYSFVLDKLRADAELSAVPLRALVLALLARLPPEDRWAGCEIFTGDSPLDPTQTRCVAMRGPGADEVQERLVEIMEDLNVPVLGVYEGGPGERELIARATPPTWSSP